MKHMKSRRTEPISKTSSIEDFDKLSFQMWTNMTDTSIGRELRKIKKSEYAIIRCDLILLTRNVSYT